MAKVVFAVCEDWNVSGSPGRMARDMLPFMVSSVSTLVDKKPLLSKWTSKLQVPRSAPLFGRNQK